jgi:hypothetical protein
MGYRNLDIFERTGRLSEKVSKVILIVFIISIIQTFILLVNFADISNFVFVLLLAIPVLFVNFHALTLNKVAYLLLLYWFSVQIISVSSNTFKFNIYYGFNYQVMIIGDIVGLDPIALFLFILTALEVDTVFRKN